MTNAKWYINKTWICLKWAGLLFKVRLLGTCVSNGWNGEYEYVDYLYKGEIYHLPKGPRVNDQN